MVLFRFAPGEADDPIDPRSLRVVVDGIDATARFHGAASEAWGMLAAPASSGNPGPITVGEHQVEARICSVRGACGVIRAAVLVTPATLATADKPARKTRLLDLLIDAARRILLP